MMAYFLNFLFFLSVVFFQLNFLKGFVNFMPFNFLIIFLVLNFIFFKKINLYYLFFLIILSGLIYDFLAQSRFLFLSSYLSAFLILYFFSYIFEKDNFISQIFLSFISLFGFHLILLIGFLVSRRIFLLKPIFLNFCCNFCFFIIILLITRRLTPRLNKNRLK